MSESVLYKKGLRLEYFTVSYNFLEAGVAILLGTIAGSIALVGFGLDSIVETLAGFVLIWRLHQHKNMTVSEEEQIEQKAVKLVALTFFILAAYVLIQSLSKLISGQSPNPSLPGMILAGISLIVMPFLAHQKVKVGKKINSRALIADAKETLACAFLSLALLLGLGLNYLFGLWQADPVVALLIVIFLLREGWESWSEKH